MLITPNEFDAIVDYDEQYVYELINRVLIVNPMPSHFERDPNEELGFLLRLFQEQHPGIIDKTIFEEYIRTGDCRRRADRAIWVGLGRVPDPEKDIPAIVVEFVSKCRRDQIRDYIHKRDEYLAIGVREYWVIDRFRRTMSVFRAGVADEMIIKERETYKTPLLPKFKSPLARLFKVADDWRR